MIFIFLIYFAHIKSLFFLSNITWGLSKMAEVSRCHQNIIHFKGIEFNLGNKLKNKCVRSPTADAKVIQLIWKIMISF